MKQFYTLLFVLLSLQACSREDLSCESLRDFARARIVFCAGGHDAKSSFVSDETRVDNLNVWVYSLSGRIVESHYFTSGDIPGGSSVSFETDAGAGCWVVLLANAGDELDAPGSISDTFTLGFSESCGMIMVGSGSLVPGSEGLEGNIILSRMMARISLSVMLDPALSAAGGVLGGSVRIRSLRLCNCAAENEFALDNPFSSGRVYDPGMQGPLTDGDYLSQNDITALHSGGTVYLYSLPNYTGASYSDIPGKETESASYVEMIVDYGELGGIGSGSAFCRFYANDGEEIGLLGGCDYRVRIVLSNDVSKALWRKDDYRLLDAGEPLIAGMSRRVDLLQKKPFGEGSCLFSLSESSIVHDDGTFSVSVNSDANSVKGVVLTAYREGSGMLYVFDRDPSDGGVPLGELALASYYPELSVDAVEADVCGTIAELSVHGRPLPEECASEIVYDGLYSIVSLEPVGDSGEICGEDFINTEPWDESLHVGRIFWQHDGEQYSWTGAVGRTLRYRATFSCGLTADFDVEVSNPIAAQLGKNAFFGEVYDMTAVDDPKPAVSALGNITTLSSPYLDADIPSSLAGNSWQSEGWRTWYGGDLYSGGSVADSYISGKTLSRISWNFPLSVLRENYGTIPVYIGKVNPWCGDYVRVQAGHFYSTKYIPTGVDIFLSSVGFDEWGGCATGNSIAYVYTVLIFRAHDGYSSLNTNPSSFAHESGGGQYLTGIGSGGYVVFDVDGIQYLETNWTGDIEEYLLYDMRLMTSYDMLCRYSPYTVLPEVEAAGASDGKTNAHGIVHVHKWSVSERVYFDYNHELFHNRVVNNEYWPEWR